MQGNPGVIADLQTTVGSELTLAAQYKFSKKLLQHVGYDISKLCKFGKQCHQWSDQTLCLLLRLEGDPQMAVDSPKDLGGIKDTFVALLALETAVCAPTTGTYQQMAKRAWDALDDESRNWWEHLIKWHAQHVDWLEKQISLINDLGDKNYKQNLL